MHERAHALREKYRELRALRVEHARGEAGDPRPRLRALARRYPGALRELDALPMEVIEARLRALEGALERGEPCPAWVSLQHAYHALFAAALEIKRLARGRRGSALDAVLGELDARGSLAARGLDRAIVGQILEPPGGRLHPVVLSEVARAAGVEPAEVERAFLAGAR